MRNERGITLVELVAALAIAGIILILIGSVFMSGLKTSDRSKMNQKLQQEANYITELVRTEFLKRPEKVEHSVITLSVSDDRLQMDGTTISEGYTYILEPTEPVSSLEMDRSKSSFRFNIRLERNEQSYEVKTTFSKLK